MGIKPAKTPGGNIDPHVWMSCSNARIIASNILKALCELEPKNKAFFEKNYQSLLSIIDKRDSTIKESFKKDPDLVCKFAIYHPILTYFARDYQLEQLAIEEEGREPSACPAEEPHRESPKREYQVLPDTSRICQPQHHNLHQREPHQANGYQPIAGRLELGDAGSGSSGTGQENRGWQVKHKNNITNHKVQCSKFKVQS